jgi:hypothetical protein
MKTMKNRLTQANFFKLCSWLQGQKDRLAKDAPSYAQLAKEAEPFLAHGVDDGTIKRAIETAELPYVPRAPHGGQAQNKTRAMVESLELRVKQLEAENLWLCKTVRHIAKDLGVAIPGEGTPASRVALVPGPNGRD